MGVMRRAIIALVVLAWGPGAYALDPAPDVSQYAHTAWKVRDGFIKGGIYAIAQTPDGYLWLGTEFGLMRFDGVRAVPWLRASTKVTNGLASAITTLGKELAASESNANAAEFHVEVEGAPRDLHPILRDEVYRLAGEALRNACKHAQAQRIEVEIRYDERQLRLRVRDDGRGIDPKHLEEEGRAGHHGLRGMRERAKLMGGKLTVWSELDSGTEVELRIPASRAYETFLAPRRSWLAEKFSGRDTEVKS